MAIPMILPEPALPRPGQLLARGVSRLLLGLGHAPLCEFVPAPGLRVDVVSVAPGGEIWIVECKSSRADFAADRKWQSYLDWCDRFFWAVDAGFPCEILPDDGGLILADSHGAEIGRMAALSRLAAARRARLLRDVARTAVVRLLRNSDPGAMIEG